MSHLLYLYFVVAVDITYQQAPIKTAGSATSADMEPHRCSFSSMTRMCQLVTFPRVHTLPASFLHNSLTRLWSQQYAGEDGVSPWRENPTTAATVPLRPRAAAGGGYSSRPEGRWVSYKPEHYDERADHAQPCEPGSAPATPKAAAGGGYGSLTTREQETLAKAMTCLKAAPSLVAFQSGQGAPSPPASRRSWLRQ